MTKVRHNTGLSLVEMLVVVGVIALLAGLVIAISRGVESQSKQRAVANVFALLRGALHEYYDDTGAFPRQPERNHSEATTHIGLVYAQLNSVPASRQILKQVSGVFVHVPTGPAAATIIRDPWETALDYVYAPDDHFPELISAGPDKTWGTDDDISSKKM
jgi:type II secretory pathway pseudopilin PulG